MLVINSLLVFLSLFQGEHMIFILLAVLLLFGGRKIPELMRGLGKGMREFKDAKDNVKSEIESGLRETPVDKDEEIRRLRMQLEQKQAQESSTQQAKP